MYWTRGLETADLNVAAAVGAMGVALDRINPVRTFTGGRGPSVIFAFEAVSNCGRFATEELFRTWRDAEWHADFPKHPWPLLAAAMGNREALVAFVKEGEGGRRYVAPLEGRGYRLRPESNVPPEAARHFGALDPAARRAAAGVPGGVSSMDIDVVAGMMALGFATVKGAEWGTGMGPEGPRRVFHLAPRSACGQMEAPWVALRWPDLEWLEERPEHPLSYVALAFENRRRLMDYIASAVPMGQVACRGKTGFLPLDAPDEAEREFFAELRR